MRLARASPRWIGAALKPWAGREDGAVAVEFAIVSVAFVLFSLGTLEFGRALAVRNKLAFAADIGAREVLNDSAITESDVEERVRAAFDARNPELLEVDLGAETVDGIQFRTVSLSYPFVLMIPQLTRDAIVLSTEERIPVT